ncbi:MAG: S41 family peptidase, partial [Porticoccaceae bacterium]
RQMRIYSAIAVLSLLTACGGGGGNKPAPLVVVGTGGGNNTAAPSGWVEGQYDSYRSLEGFCANPRSDGSYGDRVGSITDENFWIRSYSNDTYLWYRELDDIDPGTVDSTAEYFDLMKTDALTETGNPKDQFHFTYDTEEWELLSQSGISAGYGWELAFVRNSPPRSLVVAFNEPNTAAADNNIGRGAVIVSVDGAAVADGSADVLNAGLFPAELGESHTFEVRDLGASETRTVVMESMEIVTEPVKNVKTVDYNGTKVGYLTFNTHIATAEQQLITAAEQLKAANIDELVIDLRYNGGGYLDIAAELASMVAGDAATGRIFEETTFNDKYPSVNPITGRSLAPTYFPSTAAGFSAEQGSSLPKLNMSRVFVLASGGTASASEAFINGLRGIDVEVILIGANTRGKPYGFYGIDNCSTTYFTIQFKGSNAKGFGEYSDGFIPADTDDMSAANVRGCLVDDDLQHLLGDPDEARFAAALTFMETGSCPANTTPSSAKSAAMGSEKIRAYQAGDIKQPVIPGRILR